jgi:hypothetical protein
MKKLQMQQLNWHNYKFSSKKNAKNSERFFQNFISGLLIEDDEKYREFLRLNREQFNFILSLFQEKITMKLILRGPEPISSKEKLALALS